MLISELKLLYLASCFLVSSKECIKTVDVVIKAFPIDLWTLVLKPQVWYFDHHHLGFLEPEANPGANPNVRCSLD